MACFFAKTIDTRNKFRVFNLKDQSKVNFVPLGQFFFYRSINSMLYSYHQRWSRGHKARGQGQGHKKKSEAKAKDSLSKDRHSRGQGQKCSRPRPRTKDTSASVLQKKKKVFTKIFSGDLPKKTFSKKFFKRSTKF